MPYPKGKYINVKYNPDELLNKFIAYINYCRDNEIKMPNIAGFCVFAAIDKQTFYNYKVNSDYKQTMEMIDMMHEDATLNSKENPIMRIFYMKNKFEYQDKKEVAYTDKKVFEIGEVEERKQQLIEAIKSTGNK